MVAANSWHSHLKSGDASYRKSRPNKRTKGATHQHKASRKTQLPGDYQCAVRQNQPPRCPPGGLPFLRSGSKSRYCSTSTRKSAWCESRSWEIFSSLLINFARATFSFHSSIPLSLRICCE